MERTYSRLWAGTKTRLILSLITTSVILKDVKKIIAGQVFPLRMWKNCWVRQIQFQTFCRKCRGIPPAYSSKNHCRRIRYLKRTCFRNRGMRRWGIFHNNWQQIPELRTRYTGTRYSWLCYGYFVQAVILNACTMWFSTESLGFSGSIDVLKGKRGLLFDVVNIRRS